MGQANGKRGDSSPSGSSLDEDSFVNVATRTLVEGTTTTAQSTNFNISSSSKNQRVAVIGGGVSGLSCAWHLQQQACTAVVDLYEAADQLGGHAHTVSVATDYSGSANVDVDIGFMVFNDANYPNLVEWFRALDVEMEPSDMSLAVSLDGGQTVEWSSDGLAGLLGNGNNWKQGLSPQFYRFLSDLLRFNREAAEILVLHDDDPRKHVTTQHYLRQHGYSDSFATYYLLPMMAALWSASLDDVLQFPATELIGFLCNHQMLQLFHRPVWKTVAGRSRRYVEQVEACLGASHVHCGAAVTSVIRQQDGKTYHLTTSNGTVATYDQVVFACHPPTAAAILRNDSNHDIQLLDVLQQIEYADNVVYVHSDPSLMPKSAWASWNCIGKSRELLQSHSNKQNTNNPKSTGAFEGAESGFGNTAAEQQPKKVHRSKTAKEPHQELEGTQGRFKAVYVT